MAVDKSLVSGSTTMLVLKLLEEKDIPDEIKDAFIHSEDEKNEDEAYSFLELN